MFDRLVGTHEEQPIFERHEPDVRYQMSDVGKQAPEDSS